MKLMLSAITGIDYICIKGTFLSSLPAVASEPPSP